MELLPLDKPELIQLAVQWLGREENYKWLDFGDGAHRLTAISLRIMTQRDLHVLRVFTPDDSDLPVGIERRDPGHDVREPDGLALSSRNQYLDADQRRHATALHRSLEEAKALIEQGERDAAVVQRALVAHLARTPGARLDYTAVVDAETLQPIQRLQGSVLLAVAVKFGETRLIDNMLLQV